MATQEIQKNAARVRSRPKQGFFFTFLNEGDMFRVPPGNCYHLENHSEETECVLAWTIIRPFTQEEQAVEGGEGNG